MAAKNDIDITIGGKTFTLSGVESEAYLREVASYLNEKLRNFSDDAAYWKLPNDMRNVMLQLNLADDYFKERSRVEELAGQVQDLESHRDRALQELDEMQKAAQESSSRIIALESDAATLRDKAQRAAAAENSASKRFGLRRAAQTSWQKNWKPSARVRLSRTKQSNVCAKSLRRHGRPCRAN